MQPLTVKPLAMMTDEEFIDSIPQLFDVDDALWQQTQWAAYRIEASRRKKTKEFDALYSAYKKEVEPPGRGKACDMRFGFPLEADGKGRITTTIDNFLSILNNDPQFANIKFNLMADRPYREGRKWTDADDSWARHEIEKLYRIHSKDKLDDAFRVFLKGREYHPVREMIDSLVWDGKSRIYTMLTRWLKCDDTEYTREVSRLIFAGGINRVYRPGCQFDDVPVLIGTKQGEGKSSFVRWLAMDDDFATEVTEIEGQKGSEAIEGKWICEFGELLAMVRVKEQEAVKSYITRRYDHYRRPFARYTSDTPRQCMFIGTTNRREFIADKTGGRRFYPVEVHCNGYELHDHKDEVMEDIRQCWAEAKHLFDMGKLPAVANPELIKDIRAAQAEASEEDYRIAEIEEWLCKNKSIGDLTCVKQLWVYALGMPEDRPISSKDSREIGLIMQNMPNWIRVGNRRINGYGSPKAWQRVVPTVTENDSVTPSVTVSVTPENP